MRDIRTERKEERGRYIMKRLLRKWFPATFKAKWKECTLASCWDGPNAERLLCAYLLIVGGNTRYGI